jgi:hypothetical protein
MMDLPNRMGEAQERTPDRLWSPARVL